MVGFNNLCMFSLLFRQAKTLIPDRNVTLVEELWRKWTLDPNAKFSPQVVFLFRGKGECVFNVQQATRFTFVSEDTVEYRNCCSHPNRFRTFSLLCSSANAQHVMT